jgi:hypothetical protein
MSTAEGTPRPRLVSTTTAEEQPPEVGVRCNCVTAWPVEGRDFVPLANLSDSADEREMLTKAVNRAKSPIWIEFELVGDAASLRWFEPGIEPWAEFPRPRVRWQEVSNVLGLTGLASPNGDGARDAATNALGVLPLVYTLGVNRARNELGDSKDAVRLFPLVGFHRPADDKRLQAWMVRVNLAAVGRFVFTLRLPDVSWPTVSERQTRSPEGALTIRERFIPVPGEPAAAELAEGIALYQAATCGAIAARGRDWLSNIEGGFMQRAEASAGASDRGTSEGSAFPLLDPAALEDKFHRLFRLGVRAEELERALARVVGRFDNPSPRQGEEAVKTAFKETLDVVRSFQTDLRQSGDGIASVVASQQFAIADRQHDATESFHRRAAIVGAAVLIPALVAGVFGANVDLPGRDQTRGLAAMLFFMAALGIATWWGIMSLDNTDARLTRWPWKPSYAHVHAGFVVALTFFAFGVVTLTPAVDTSLGGADASLGIAGVVLIALGLAVSLWCWVNRPATSKWWGEDRLVTGAARTGRVVGPAALLAGAALAAYLF